MLSPSLTQMLSLFVFVLGFSLVSAVPWDISSRTSISSTSGGIMTHIEAMGPKHLSEMGYSRHLMGLPQGTLNQPFSACNGSDAHYRPTR